MRRPLDSVLTRSGSGIRPAGVMGLVAVDLVMGVVFELPVASRGRFRCLLPRVAGV